MDAFKGMNGRTWNYLRNNGEQKTETISSICIIWAIRTTILILGAILSTM